MALKAEVKVYTGNPREIIINLATEMADRLSQGGEPPSGVHVLALLHLAAAMARAGNRDKDVGQMPSFKLMLRLLSHSSTGSDWTIEELKEFDTEFQAIVESLGGCKLEAGSKAKEQPVLMSPSLGAN